MTFGLFVPSNHGVGSSTISTPVLFWLSGLTCDDTNFANKAGSKAFEAAEKHVRYPSNVIVCVLLHFVCLAWLSGVCRLMY